MKKITHKEDEYCVRTNLLEIPKDELEDFVTGKTSMIGDLDYSTAAEICKSNEALQIESDYYNDGTIMDNVFCVQKQERKEQ